MLDALCTDGNLTTGAELLRGQYKIVRQIGRGGFGVTYLANDSLNRQVVIKECFPELVCVRKGRNVIAGADNNRPHFEALLKQFKAEAQSLAMLEYPGIVGVHQVFEENGTAYMAMEFVEGIDLMTLAERANGQLSCDILKTSLAETLDAVKYLHEQGFLHRDISPDNLILGPDGRITLIDLGAASVGFRGEPSEIAQLFAVKDGYSPLEFYEPGQVQSPSSDLYSIGATFHFLITGTAPPDSLSRVGKIAAGDPDPYSPLLYKDINLDQRILATIDSALAIHQQDRLQSVEQWKADLVGPRPIKEVELDPQLLQRISLLVETTNKAVDQGESAKRNTRRAPKTTCQEAGDTQSPKQFVDIFGNPIDDVEEYLREQDKKSKNGKPQNPRRKQAAKPRRINVNDEASRPIERQTAKSSKSRYRSGGTLNWVEASKHGATSGLLPT